MNGTVAKYAYAATHTYIHAHTQEPHRLHTHTYTRTHTGTPPVYIHIRTPETRKDSPVLTTITMTREYCCGHNQHISKQTSVGKQLSLIDAPVYLPDRLCKTRKTVDEDNDDDGDDDGENTTKSLAMAANQCIGTHTHTYTEQNHIASVCRLTFICIATPQ